MKRLSLCVGILLALCVTNSLAQKRNSTNTAKYYFDITRPNCCALTNAKWQQIAASLRKSGISTFFGLYEVQNYRESWKPVKLQTTTSEEGWLILGPFASEASALTALRKLPKLLPKGSDTFNGVEAGPTEDPQTWQVGMYQINGFKTSLPITVYKSKVERQSGTIEGIVIERNEFATGGYEIIVESDGVKYRVVMQNRWEGVKTVVGNVDTIGNRVSVTYKARTKDPDGYDLRATRVVEVKAQRNIVTPNQTPRGTAQTNMVLKRTLAGLNGWAQSVAFSPDSKIVLAGSPTNDKNGGAGKLWELTTGRLMLTLKWSSCGFQKAAFSPDSKFLAIASGASGGYLENCNDFGQITIVNAQTGTSVKVLDAPDIAAIQEIAFLTDGKTIIAGTDNGELQFWDFQTGRKKITLEGHRGSIHSIAVALDGNTIASGSCDGTVKLWNIQSKELKQTLYTKTGTGQTGCDSVAFSIDSKMLISETWFDETAKIWDVQTGKMKRTLQGAKPPFAFSPDGMTLASGGVKKNTILLWDMKSGTVKQELIGHTDYILALEFSSDGRMLVSGSQDRSVKIWEWKAAS